MENYIEEYDRGLPELLESKDELHVLSSCDNNAGSCYLLYHPRYPWDKSGGFKSREEVVKYMSDLVRSYCRDDVDEQEIINIIDYDVLEVGND